MSLESENKYINKFFNNLDKSDVADLINLKRNYNKSFYECSIKAKISFYKILPSEIKYNEYIWFFISTLFAYQGFEGNICLSKAIKNMADDNIKHKFGIILAEDLNIDSLLLYKIGQLIKMCNEKGYYIDSLSLLEDLLNWNKETKNVQKRWAKEVYSQEINLKSEGEKE